jgi:hypothetical protein
MFTVANINPTQGKLNLTLLKSQLITQHNWYKVWAMSRYHEYLQCLFEILDIPSKYGEHDGLIEKNCQTCHQ